MLAKADRQGMTGNACLALCPGTTVQKASPITTENPKRITQGSVFRLFLESAGKSHHPANHRQPGNPMANTARG